MRIVHLVASLSRDNGGLPMAAAGLAIAVTKALATNEARERDAQDRVTLVGGVTAGRGQSDTVLPSLDVPTTLHLELVEERPRSVAALTASGFAEVMSRLLPETDVLHLHGVWDPSVLRSALMAKRAGVPFVLCPHGMWAPWSLEQRFLKKTVLWHLAYRRAYAQAAAFHCLSANEERFARARRLDVPLYRLPNGIDVEELSPLPSPEPFYAWKPELRDVPFVLFLGRLHVGKGLDLLASAFEHFVQAGGAWHLVVMGPDGDQSTRSDFERRIARARLGERVHLVGPAFGDVKIAALRASAALVHPSRQEAFGLSIAEALACGRPVVISEGSPFDEVGTAGAGFVTKLEVRAIAQALLELERDPERALSMGKRGRALIESKYTWPAVAASAIRLYREITGGHTPAAQSDGSPIGRDETSATREG